MKTLKETSTDSKREKSAPRNLSASQIHALNRKQRLVKKVKSNAISNK